MKKLVSTKVRTIIRIMTLTGVIPIVGLTRLFCVIGEGLKIVAFIQNNSSREIKPKYCIYRKHSFFANGKRRLDTKDLLKEVGDPIPPSSKENVTRVITIPLDIEPSIHNCNIIKVEHRLRVSSYDQKNNLIIGSHTHKLKN